MKMISKKRYKHQWYLKNKKRLSKKSHDSYIKNQDKIIKKVRLYYKKNRYIILLKKKKYNQKNRAKRKKYMNKYNQKNIIQVREWRRKSQKKYSKKYPEKEKAHTISEKIMIPKNQICEDCNKRKAVHKHHEDYDKPLKVKFLCVKCHNKIHNPKGD